jgi:hypothetical protein
MNSVENMPQVGQNMKERSKWIKSIRKLLKSHIHQMLFVKMNYVDNMKTLCWFQRIKQLTTCSGCYYKCLFNELGFTSTSGNSTYTRINLTKDEILQNHISVLYTFNILRIRISLNYLCWIPKLHKNPYKDTLLVPISVLFTIY